MNIQAPIRTHLPAVHPTTAPSRRAVRRSFGWTRIAGVGSDSARGRASGLCRSWLAVMALVCCGSITWGQAGLAPLRWIDVAVEDERTYFLRSNDLVIMDVSEPSRPTELEVIGIRGAPRQLIVRDGEVWIAAGSRGLIWLDLNEPQNPQIITEWETPGLAHDLVQDGAYVWLADGREGLRVIDLTVPLRPRERAIVSTRDEVVAVDAFGSLLAIAEKSEGVRVFNRERADAPREQWLLREAAGARDVLLTADHLWVARGRQGLQCYRLSKSGRPVLEFEHKARAAVLSLSTDDAEFVVASLGSGGIDVWNLEEPLSRKPNHEIKLHRSTPSLRAALIDGRVWIAGDIGGLGLVDLLAEGGPARLLPRERKLNIRMGGRGRDLDPDAGR